MVQFHNDAVHFETICFGMNRFSLTFDTVRYNNVMCTIQEEAVQSDLAPSDIVPRVCYLDYCMRFL